MPVLRGFGRFDDGPAEVISDKIKRRYVAGEQGMVVWWEVEAGGHAAAHSHPHEQIVWMVSGKIDLRLGDELRTMGPGEVCVIPGGVEHEVWFVEDTLVVDVFAPPREDFISGGPPPYMREA